MILIYICNDDKIPLKHIENCKISPSTGILNYRTDLEFYVHLSLTPDSTDMQLYSLPSQFTGQLSQIGCIKNIKNQLLLRPSLFVLYEVYLKKYQKDRNTNLKACRLI